MLKVLRAHWVLAAVAFLVLLFGVAWETSLVPHYVKHCTYQYETYVEKCAPDHILFVALGETREFIEKYERLFTVLSTIAVAGFTGTLWWSTRGLWQVTYNAAENQLVHNRQVERAYVKMSHTGPGLMFNHTGSDLEVEIANHGTTPANVTRLLLNSTILPDGQNLPLPPTYDLTSSVTQRAFLVAKDRTFMSLELDATLDQVRAMPEGTVLCVYGFVDYIDAFGVRHRGGYARQYDGALGDKNNLGFTARHEGYNYDRVRERGEGDDWND